MVRKRRKKKGEKKVISITPKTEAEEIIEEYKDYVSIIKHGLIPPPEPIELPKTKCIKYLGTVDRFIIKGPITGQRYCFTAKDRIGTIVAIEDYDGLLKRVRPARRCCGGKTIPEQPYFGPV